MQLCCKPAGEIRVLTRLCCRCCWRAELCSWWRSRASARCAVVGARNGCRTCEKQKEAWGRHRRAKALRKVLYLQKVLACACAAATGCDDAALRRCGCAAGGAHARVVMRAFESERAGSDGGGCASMCDARTCLGHSQDTADAKLMRRDVEVAVLCCSEL